MNGGARDPDQTDRLGTQCRDTPGQASASSSLERRVAWPSRLQGPDGDARARQEPGEALFIPKRPLPVEEGRVELVCVMRAGTGCGSESEEPFVKGRESVGLPPRVWALRQEHSLFRTQGQGSRREPALNWPPWPGQGRPSGRSPLCSGAGARGSPDSPAAAS